MKSRILFLLGILITLCAQIHATSYTSIADGNWDNPAIWSPYGVPENNDDVIINDSVILTEDMLGWSKGVSLLTINAAGSLISAGTEGVKIDNDGFFTVSGSMNVYEVYFKGSAEVIIHAGAQITVQTDWTTQGENSGDLDPFIVDGSLDVTGTFEDDGSVITGTGTITAGEWELEGTFLFYGQYDPNNPPDPNQTLYGSTWEGTLSNDWNNGANWLSQEIPGASDVAYIPSELTVYPVISSGISAQCGELILEYGSTVTLNPGGNLTVFAGVTNYGTIIINSDATGTGSLIDGGLIDGPGNAQVQRFLADQSGTSSYYMHQVCAPVAGQTLQAFNLIPGRTYAYEFLPATNSWSNISDPSHSIPSKKGIILSTLNNTGNQTLVFNGTMVSGTQSVAITPTDAAGDTSFYLIGNPYLSPIDWEQVNPQTGIYNFVYIWDPSVPEYKAYVQGTGGNNSCRYIQVGQAFFIGAGQTASSLTFENSNRTHQNQPFLKLELIDYLEVSLSGGNGTGSTTFIRLKDGATTAYDEGQEADKWYSIYGDEANDIYTVSSDGIALQVASFPRAENQPVSIPLNMKPATSGQFSFIFNGMDSFEPGMKIFLEDKLNSGHGWTNIKSSPEYQFSAFTGDPEDRFIIHIGRDITNIDPPSEVDKPLLFITTESQNIIIHNPEDIDIEAISVLDLSGREVISHGFTKGSLIRLPSVQHAGFYLVKVKTAQGIITEKVILR